MLILILWILGLVLLALATVGVPGHDKFALLPGGLFFCFLAVFLRGL
jgi:hypothetical protein